MLVSALTWAGVAAVALFVGWPLFQARRGIAVRDGDSFSPLEREKREALAAIKEAEFDRTMGKLSEEDFASLRARYRTQALAAIAALEAARPAAGGATETRFCGHCGAALTPRTNFCPACGTATRGPAA
jgi:NADH pyrophosphatase NudC (nudix superfamily)